MHQYDLIVFWKSGNHMDFRIHTNRALSAKTADAECFLDEDIKNDRSPYFHLKRGRLLCRAGDYMEDNGITFFMIRTLDGERVMPAYEAPASDEEIDAIWEKEGREESYAPKS